MIRWLIRRDIKQVLKIEEQSFEYPWSDAEMCYVLRNPRVIGLVYEQEEKILGYVIYELHKHKLRILNLAVHPLHRRKGIGGGLVNYIKNKLVFGRRTELEFMVAETNLAGQFFLRSLEFRATEIIRRPYEEIDWDGYLMEYSLLC